jgi:hypothetical protein
LKKLGLIHLPTLQKVSKNILELLRLNINDKFGHIVRSIGKSDLMIATLVVLSEGRAKGEFYYRLSCF